MARPDSGLNMSGIYKITSKVHPERIYIGSAVNFRTRKGGHFLTLKKNVHRNPKLQAHYNKYGVDDLTFSIVAICSKEELRPENNVVWIEQFFIDAYKPWFNINKIAGSSLGVIRSAETREKVGKAGLGREPWNKGKKGVMPVPWNKGMKGVYKMPPESTEKKRQALIGKKRPPFSEEWIKNISEGHKGIKQSEESKRKKSEVLMNHPVSKETRRKLSIANTGKKKPSMTKEQHKNLSVAVKEWWRKRKENGLNNKAA